MSKQACATKRWHAGTWVAAALALSIASAQAVVADSGSLTLEEARRLVERLAPRVEELRGLSFNAPVEVEVVGDGAARDYVLARVRAFEQEAHLETLQRVYRLLGLLSEDADLLGLMLGAMEEQIGGFYDPAAGAYYLLEDVPEPAAPIFTVHELTHALEDQHYDLDARLRATIEDDDRSLALSAVHEGSATILMNLYTMGAVGRGELDPGALRAIVDSDAGRAEKLRALPDVLQRQLLGPYVLGAMFLGGTGLAHLENGYPEQAVDRALRDGPTSSEQILHPEKFWNGTLRDDPREVQLRGVGKSLGQRWDRVGEGVLGELTLGSLVGAATPLGLGEAAPSDASAWTNVAASGWAGDRWELWESDDDSVLLLRTDWDSAEDAAEFAAALRRAERLRWRVRGDRVAIVAGSAGNKAQRLLSRMLR